MRDDDVALCVVGCGNTRPARPLVGRRPGQSKAGHGDWGRSQRPAFVVYAYGTQTLRTLPTFSATRHSVPVGAGTGRLGVALTLALGVGVGCTTDRLGVVAGSWGERGVNDGSGEASTIVGAVDGVA